MQDTLFSIIIPVYKAENYIRECIDSVNSQTLKEYELILIDDGSPDSSGAICDEYATSNSKIRVIHQNNSGVSAARNRGLEAASGKYVMFVDSDDKLSDNQVLSKMEQAISQHPNCEILKFNHMVLKPDGTLVETRFAEQRAEYSGNEMDAEGFWSKIISLQKNVLVTLFSRDFLNKHKIRFQEKMKLMEDHYFMLKSINQLSGGVYVKEKVYICRLANSESLTHTIDESGIISMLQSVNVLEDFNKMVTNPIIRQAVHDDINLRIFYSLINASHIKRGEHLNQCLNSLKRHKIKKGKLSPGLSGLVLTKLFNLSPKLAVVALKIKNLVK